MPDSNIDTKLVDVQEALCFLKAERRDQKREYDNAVRKLEKAHTLALSRRHDSALLIDDPVVFAPDVQSLINNPSLL